MKPVWVWLGLGGRDSEAAFAGRVIVIGALLVNVLWGMRERANSA